MKEGTGRVEGASRGSANSVNREGQWGQPMGVWFCKEDLRADPTTVNGEAVFVKQLSQSGTAPRRKVFSTAFMQQAC